MAHVAKIVLVLSGFACFGPTNGGVQRPGTTAAVEAWPRKFAVKLEQLSPAACAVQTVPQMVPLNDSAVAESPSSLADEVLQELRKANQAETGVIPTSGDRGMDINSINVLTEAAHRHELFPIYMKMLHGSQWNDDASNSQTFDLEQWQACLAQYPMKLNEHVDPSPRCLETGTPVTPQQQNKRDSSGEIAPAAINSSKNPPSEPSSETPVAKAVTTPVATVTPQIPSAISQSAHVSSKSAQPAKPAKSAEVCKPAKQSRQSSASPKTKAKTKETISEGKQHHSKKKKAAAATAAKAKAQAAAKQTKQTTNASSSKRGGR